MCWIRKQLKPYSGPHPTKPIHFFSPLPSKILTNPHRPHPVSIQEDAIEHHDPGPLRSQHNLFLAVWSQFCYVGAQVALANYFINFATEAGRTSASASDLLAVGQGLYTLGRFAAGLLFMSPRVKPRYVLAVLLACCFIFSVAAVTTRGTASVAMLIVVLCAESACFATIFTLGLRGLGRHTKVGGSLLVAGISGGMVFPPMAGAVVTRHSAHAAMAIPMMGYLLALVYPVYVNVYKRGVMDGHRATDVGIVGTGGEGKGVELEAQESRVEERAGDAKELRI